MVFWRPDHLYEPWMKNLSFNSIGTEPLPGILHPNPSASVPFCLDGHTHWIWEENIGWESQKPPSCKIPGMAVPAQGCKFTMFTTHQAGRANSWSRPGSLCLCITLLPACLVEGILNILTVAVKLYFWVCNPVQKLQMFKLFPPGVWWK